MKLDYFKLEGFDWNDGNMNHIYKHGVIDKVCEEVFSNKPLIINEDEEHSRIEKRYRVYGKSLSDRFLNIIFTVRKNKIRIISVRDMNKKERKEYLMNGGGN